VTSDDTITATVSAGPGGTHRAPATAAEVAAVVAALSVFTSGGSDDAVRAVPRWRFSGRWWTKPVPSRRDRP
jgi:hypothetical protein